MWMNWLVWTAGKQIVCLIKVLLIQRIVLQKLRQPVQISPGIEMFSNSCCHFAGDIFDRQQVWSGCAERCDVWRSQAVCWREWCVFVMWWHGLSVGLWLLSKQSKTWDEVTYLIMWIWTNKSVTGSVCFMCTRTISLIHGGRAGTGVFRGIFDHVNLNQQIRDRISLFHVYQDH